MRGIRDLRIAKLVGRARERTRIKWNWTPRPKLWNFFVLALSAGMDAVVSAVLSGAPYILFFLVFFAVLIVGVDNTLVQPHSCSGHVTSLSHQPSVEACLGVDVCYNLSGTPIADTPDKFMVAVLASDSESVYQVSAALYYSLHVGDDVEVTCFAGMITQVVYYCRLEKSGGGE